jgi:hypothetical protein
VYYLDEDDNTTSWQSWNWTSDHCGPPSVLCTQMNNISNKGRYVTDVTFESTSGQWYVDGQKRDGTGFNQCWGGGHLHPLKEENFLNYFLDQLIIMAVIKGLYCMSQMATNVWVILILIYPCGWIVSTKGVKLSARG